MNKNELLKAITVNDLLSIVKFKAGGNKDAVHISVDDSVITIPFDTARIGFNITLDTLRKVLSLAEGVK